MFLLQKKKAIPIKRAMPTTPPKTPPPIAAATLFFSAGAGSEEVGSVGVVPVVELKPAAKVATADGVERRELEFEGDATTTSPALLVVGSGEEGAAFPSVAGSDDGEVTSPFDVGEVPVVGLEGGDVVVPSAVRVVV